jgi:hypothetical protein
MLSVVKSFLLLIIVTVTMSTQTVRSSWDYESLHCANANLTKPLSPSEINKHYNDIMTKTARWRTCPSHSYQNFVNGVWMENIWIKTFMDKIATANGDVTSVFPGGAVPLFIQWVDCWISGNRSQDDLLSHVLLGVLKPNVMYVTVSQADGGILPLRYKNHPVMARVFSNIFTFSGGGYGHAPVPLLPPVQAKFQPQTCGGINQSACRHTASFMGRQGTGPMREIFFSAMRNEALRDNSIVCCAPRDNWAQVMRQSKVSLCPRGYGRTSFRCFEAIQMGLIPIYTYNDLAWLPYAGSNASMASIGMAVHIKGLQSMLAAVRSWDPQEMSRRREVLESVRESHFTMPGMMDQIDRYIKYGTEGSDIRCSPLPNKQI